jgi:dolichol kinase
MREEVTRRLVHASGSLLPLAYLAVPAITWRVVRGVLVAAAVVVTVLEAFRLLGGLEWAIYERLTREYERDNLAGYALGMYGAAATVLAVGPRIGVPALLILTWVDPVSGLLGSGELRAVKQASVLAVTFGLGTLIASFFVPPLVAVLAGVAVTVADGIKPVVAGYVVDDNLTIPTATAAVMALGVRYLPPVV